MTSLEGLTKRQWEKIKQPAAISVVWPVNLTQRVLDFSWGERYVGDLEVGANSLMPPKIGSRINLHNDFTRLAVKLWLTLLNNRDELPALFEQAGNNNARKLKTEWISRCLSLATVKELTAQEVAAQCAPELWELGRALLLEAWGQARQSAFGSVLTEYEGKDQTGKDKYTESYARTAIFKQLGSTFLRLLGRGRSSNKSVDSA